MRYESSYHAIKENEDYTLLQTGISQQILKVVDRSFRSFFHLLKRAKRGGYRFQDVTIPLYLGKDGYFPRIRSTNAIVIKDGYVQVPMSHAFQRKHPDLERIQIPFPDRLERKTVKEVRILARERARFLRSSLSMQQHPQPRLG